MIPVRPETVVPAKSPKAPRSAWRRRSAIAIVLLVIAGIVGAVFLYSPSQRPAQVGRFQRQGNQPIPTLTATARVADVPVYLDGVGTTKALNTVTVSSQVDGKLHQHLLQGRTGRRAGLRTGADRPGRLSGPIRSGGSQESAGRGDARQCPRRPRALRPAGADQCRSASSRRTPKRRWLLSWKPR